MRSRIGSWSDRLRSNRIALALPSGEADCLRPLPCVLNKTAFVWMELAEICAWCLAPPSTEQVGTPVVLRFTADDVVAWWRMRGAAFPVQRFHAVSGKVVPITREESRYLEPSSHVVKRITGQSGSDHGLVC
jgi:hypothetical protein